MLDVLTRNIRPGDEKSYQAPDMLFQTGNYTDLRFINEENLDLFIEEYIRTEIGEERWINKINSIIFA